MSDDVYDLDAVAAEETKEPLRFTYRGRQWELAHMTGVDWRIVEQANEGDIAAIRYAFHAGFGCFHDPVKKPEEIKHNETALAFDAEPQPIAAMTALFRRWLKHNGLTEGESEASPDSSESTARPSKPASRRTTRASDSASSSRARSPRGSS